MSTLLSGEEAYRAAMTDMGHATARLTWAVNEGVVKQSDGHIFLTQQLTELYLQRIAAGELPAASAEEQPR